MMNAVMIVTGNGAMVILTSHKSVADPAFLEKLAHKGIDKFIAYELSLDKAKERYGGHFFVVARDLRESDDLRVLDYNGERAFKLFSFAEFGPPILHEGPAATEAAA